MAPIHEYVIGSLYNIQVIHFNFKCRDAATYSQALWNEASIGNDEHIVQAYTIGEEEVALPFG